MASNRRPNRVQRRDLHSGLRSGAASAYTGSGDHLNISSTPQGPARGDLDGYYPSPSIRDAAVTSAKIADDAITAGKIDPSVAPAVHVRFLSGSDDMSDIDTGGLAAGDLILVSVAGGSTYDGIYYWIPDPGTFARWTLDAQKMRLVHVMEGPAAGRLYELVTDGGIAVGTDAMLYEQLKASVEIESDDGAETLNTFSVVGGHGLHTTLAEGMLTVWGEWIVDLVSDANIAIDGTATTCDGVTITAGMLIATPNQTTAADRDIWIASTTGNWARYAPALTSGQLVRVKRGTRYAGTLWQLMTTAAITRGTTTLLWWRTDGRLIVYPVPDGNATIPSFLGRTYVRVPLLTNIRTYTLPADPMPGQEIVFQYNSTGTSQFQLARSGTQTINGGTANLAIALTNYRRAVAIYDDAGQWLVNSYAV